MSRTTYAVVKRGNAPSRTLVMGREELRKTRLKVGDVVEVNAAGKRMLLWVTSGNVQGIFMGRELDFLGGEEVLVSVKKVIVREALFVELESINGFRREEAGVVAKDLIGAPVAKGSIVAAYSSKGILGFRVRKCEPLYSIITSETKILFS